MKHDWVSSRSFAEFGNQREFVAHRKDSAATISAYGHATEVLPPRPLPLLTHT
jgi:hypothetical protein